MTRWRRQRMYRARAWVPGAPGTVGRVESFAWRSSAELWCVRQRGAGLAAEWWRIDELPEVAS